MKANQKYGNTPAMQTLTSQNLVALFMGIALSISALPIIARILMDMGLYRSDLGMVVIGAAICNDLVGWIIFAVLLGLIGTPGHGGFPVGVTLFLILAFAGITLTLGRQGIHRALPVVQAWTRWPGGELSLAMVLGLLAAAFTEWIGIHGIFGAFIMGAALGDSPRLEERSRVIIEKFVSVVFAPVFFAGVGLHLNFREHFDLTLVLVITLLACGCKFLGGLAGARWAGMLPREARAVGAAMLSVGAMGIRAWQTIWPVRTDSCRFWHLSGPLRTGLRRGIRQKQTSDLRYFSARSA